MEYAENTVPVSKNQRFLTFADLKKNQKIGEKPCQKATARKYRFFINFLAIFRQF